MGMDSLYIEKIASKTGIDGKYLLPYGKDKAKIDLSINDGLSSKEDGKLILVTSLTPTKAGEGKTTTAIALEDGLAKIRKKAILCLREPSLGPVFGLKGGATGAGKAKIIPSEDIDLHFTGDMHAITSATNLVAAVLDNSIHFGNPLNIDESRILWSRAIDMNDRALRKEGFVLTAASEIMAILCLSLNEEDFLKRISKAIVAFSKDGKPVTIKDLGCTHAVMRLMKDAFKPNLVSTLEGNPCFIHGGPFANIAHGTNSLIATKLAMKLAPITIVEAGFGSDLGAEKFLDIVSDVGGFSPSLVVMVVTIKALKSHGGVPFDDLGKENVDAMEEGLKNLEIHLENISKFGMQALVAINHFDSDSQEEIETLEKWLEAKGYQHSLVDAYSKGGDGAIDLANKVINSLEAKEAKLAPIYKKEEGNIAKIEKIAKEIYRSDKVEFTSLALDKIKYFELAGLKDPYICIAKTPMSISDDPKAINAPIGNTLHINDVRISSGADFLIPVSGSINLLPALPKEPLAVKMEDEPWKY